MSLWDQAFGWDNPHPGDGPGRWEHDWVGWLGTGLSLIGYGLILADGPLPFLDILGAPLVAIGGSLTVADKVMDYAAGKYLDEGLLPFTEGPVPGAIFWTN